MKAVAIAAGAIIAGHVNSAYDPQVMPPVRRALYRRRAGRIQSAAARSRRSALIK